MPVNSCLPPLIAFSLVSIRVIDACSILTFVFENWIICIPFYRYRASMCCEVIIALQFPSRSSGRAAQFQSFIEFSGTSDVPGRCV